jgi:hypothetical protein
VRTVGRLLHTGSWGGVPVHFGQDLLSSEGGVWMVLSGGVFTGGLTGLLGLGLVLGLVYDFDEGEYRES